MMRHLITQIYYDFIVVRECKIGPLKQITKLYCLQKMFSQTKLLPKRFHNVVSDCYECVTVSHFS